MEKASQSQLERSMEPTARGRENLADVVPPHESYEVSILAQDDDEDC